MQSRDPIYEDRARAFLTGGGDVGARIRAYAWATHPLGPPESWPVPLQTLIGVLLGTIHPMFILWGPELHCFYNDAYARSLGPEKHPALLGAPARAHWRESWQIIGPELDLVMQGRGATWHVDDPVPVIRHGHQHELYWTYSCSPIPYREAPHGVGGVLVLCNETTSQVLNERRQAFLLRLEDAIRPLHDPRRIMDAAVDLLGQHLDADRVGFGLVQADDDSILLETAYARGVAPLAGTYLLANLDAETVARHRRGETLVQNDVAVADPLTAAAFAAINTRSYVTVPLVRNGRLRATLFVNGREPRAWTAPEIALIESVAARVWDSVERARAEADLKLTQQGLLEADQRKDEFLAILAHELRNPLAPMRSVAQILATPHLSEERRQWAQGVLERQVGHMALLLDDLLDVARITQRKLDLRKQNVNLVGIVDQAIETARPSIDAKSHALTVSLPPGDVVLHVDPLRLSQVISNLLTNAAKYTDPGGAINLCGTVDGNDLNIAVSDDGIGIAPEFLERIFEWFSQARNGASRSEGGLGIGLALVKGLVKLHGGTITAHSDGPGRGSRFSVHLPCAVIRSGAIPDVGHKTEAVATARRRVMVVDDNADAADSLRELLEMSGHEVCVAHGGHAALSLAESYRPDVVLLDIGMPDMDGCEAAAALRRTPWGSRMRLIALTGLGQESDRRRTQQAGFDSHLTKPVHLDDVMPLLAGQ